MTSIPHEKVSSKQQHTTQLSQESLHAIADMLKGGPPPDLAALNGDGAVMEAAVEMYRANGVPGLTGWLATMENAMPGLMARILGLSPKPAETGFRLDIKTGLAFMQKPPLDYLDDDETIIDRDITVIAGLSTAGKTLWTTYKLAEIAEKAPVVFIAGEGLNPDRLIAQDKIARKDGKAVNWQNFHIVETPINLTADEKVDAYIDQLEPLKPRVIAIDSLTACAYGFGAVANDTGDNSAIMNRIRLRIIERLGCAVLLIHHFTKDGKGYNGSNAIEGSVQNMYYISRDEETITLRVKKRRDGDANQQCCYRIITDMTRVHPRTGKDIQGAVMVKSERTIDLPTDKLTGNQQRVLEALDGYPKGLRYATLMQATVLPKTTLLGVLRKLIKSGLVSQAESGEPYSITLAGTERLQGRAGTYGTKTGTDVPDVPGI